MKTAEPLIPLPAVLFVTIVAAGTWIGCGDPRAPEWGSEGAAEAVAGRSHRAMLLDKLASRDIVDLPACVGKFREPYFVIQFEGLVDLASEDPGATGIVSQDHVEVALVDATNRDEVEVVGREFLSNHLPVLYFKDELNRGLGEDSGTAGFRELSLEDTRVVVRESSLEDVWMHREEPARARPAADDRCSLGWMPLADALAPGSRLRNRVFGNGAPHPDYVTSLFHIEEGEVFTVDFFPKRGGGECVVRFPRGFERAMTKSFGVAVPVDEETRTLTLVAITPRGPETWPFTLPEGVRRAFLHVTNHPDAEGGDQDFTAHFSLREGFDVDGAVVPIPAYDDCEDGRGPDDNPQCGPDDNRWSDDEPDE